MTPTSWPLERFDPTLDVAEGVEVGRDVDGDIDEDEGTDMDDVDETIGDEGDIGVAEVVVGVVRVVGVAESVDGIEVGGIAVVVMGIDSDVVVGIISDVVVGEKRPPYVQSELSGILNNKSVSSSPSMFRAREDRFEGTHIAVQHPNISKIPCNSHLDRNRSTASITQ